MIIATHDGSFHADETTACAILTFLHENSTIIRSRDEIELEKADIVIDVSNKNDSKHFDHHSKDFIPVAENAVKALRPEGELPFIIYVKKSFLNIRLDIVSAKSYNQRRKLIPL